MNRRRLFSLLAAAPVGVAGSKEISNTVKAGPQRCACGSPLHHTALQDVTVVSSASVGVVRIARNEVCSGCGRIWFVV